MRHAFFGDKRDYLKWSSLLLLAQRAGINRIVQVAMWTDQQPPNFRIQSAKDPVDDDQHVTALVVDFFHRHNNLHSIQALGEQLDIAIQVMPQPFTHAARAAYFDHLAEEIRASEEPTIWFFDPDTGIEPDGGGGVTHVLRQELAQAFDDLPRGSLLVCYQHAWFQEGWITGAQARFSRACNVPADQLEVFTSPDAGDAVILAVQKW